MPGEVALEQPGIETSGILGENLVAEMIGESPATLAYGPLDLSPKRRNESGLFAGSRNITADVAQDRSNHRYTKYRRQTRELQGPGLPHQKSAQAGMHACGEILLETGWGG